MKLELFLKKLQDLKRKFYLEFLLKDLFDFAPHQENASHGSEYKLTMKWKKNDTEGRKNYYQCQKLRHVILAVLCKEILWINFFQLKLLLTRFKSGNLFFQKVQKLKREKFLI